MVWGVCRRLRGRHSWGPPRGVAYRAHTDELCSGMEPSYISCRRYGGVGGTVAVEGTGYLWFGCLLP